MKLGALGVLLAWVVALGNGVLGGAPPPSGVEPQLRTDCQTERHRQFDPLIHPATEFYVDGERPPGTLLLAMVVKNEAETLDKTLPRWANIIDYWVIGVDDNNTDNTPEVIHRHLSGIPGEILTVTFDGMGPTYTKVIQHGWCSFPEATHGIMTDADYAPLYSYYDKKELDIHSAKELFRLYPQDSNGVKQFRKMDWIYRNTPRTFAWRRTHQAIYVPPFAGDDGYITVSESGLDVEETAPGYQDRTLSVEGKFFRYAEMLLKDIEDMPGDPRTLYYLGDSYKGIYSTRVKEGRVNKATDKWLLDEALKWFRRRTTVSGYYEELYFAHIAIGQIHERYLGKFQEAIDSYKKALAVDPVRIDAHFYIGQRLKLSGKFAKALKPLAAAAELDIPDRSVFHWIALYKCSSKVDFADTLVMAAQERLLRSEHLLDYTRRALQALDKVFGKDFNICEELGEIDNARKAEQLKPLLEAYLREYQEDLSKEVPSAAPMKRLNKAFKSPQFRQLAKFASAEDMAAVEKIFQSWEELMRDNPTAESEVIMSSDSVSVDFESTKTLSELIHGFANIKDGDDQVPCRNYRLAVKPYLQAVAEPRNSIDNVIEGQSSETKDNFKALHNALASSECFPYSIFSES